ncbi:hypothetical protein A2U01_0066154, partial [Trifolium medium]|nr:hypothetical protein [Trifolium medium]
TNYRKEMEWKDDPPQGGDFRQNSRFEGKVHERGRDPSEPATFELWQEATR